MIPYTAYKSTNLPWLPRIPEHWEIRKLRHLLSLVSTKNRPDMPLLSVVREKGVILRNVSSKEENHNYIPDDLSNYKLVKKGQFVMNKMKAWQGSYGVSDYDGIVSPAYFVFNLHGVMPSFFHRALRSKQYVPYFGQASDGIRVGQWDLSIPRMKEIPFAVPPPAEQEQIVRYLDSMTAKINKLVRTKKKQIALLQEQRQAIINHAVTKGLDPNAEMKDSGIDWIGEIPKHWGIHPFRSIASIKSITGQNEKELLSVYLDKGVIRFSDVKEKRTNVTSLDLSNYQLVEPGDFVLNNQQAWRGSVGISFLTGIVSPAYFVLKMSDILNSRFANYLLRSPAIVNCYFVSSKGIGSIQRNLVWQQLKAFSIVVPPIEEQMTIVAFLDKAVERIDNLIVKLQEQIENMLVFKQGLISEVATGQIDVRNNSVEDVTIDDLIPEDDSPSEIEDESTTDENEE